MEKLWTTNEAALCLGVSEAQIEQLVKAGRLTAYKLAGKFLRFRPDQVEALKGQIGSQPVAPGAESAPDSWWVRLSEFVYFYDFYLASGVLLAMMTAYLVWRSQ
jgi:excisionase family DNA binding protein